MSEASLNGGCGCGAVRYRLTKPPLFVHCCHCTDCQRESGAAFAINALIETSALDVTKGTPAFVKVPTASGKPQTFARCPKCQLALWSHYGGAGKSIAFLRAGTLDTPNNAPPDIHIYTRSKQAWVILPKGVPAVPVYYKRDQYWPADSLKRRAALFG